MDSGLILSLTCLFVSAALGIHLAWKNLNNTERIQANLEARRAYKREKNRRLARFYGIDLDKTDQN